MALLVEAAREKWLVDVGFGSAVPFEPLKWNSDADQAIALGPYRLVPTTFGRRLEVASDGAWRPLYEVFHEPPEQEYFDVGSWYTSTHPDSIFRRSLIVARASSEGRTTLFGSELTFRSPRGETRREQLDGDQVEAVLRDLFKLRVDPALRRKLTQLASQIDRRLSGIGKR